MILGAFKSTAVCLGSYLWKTPFRLSQTQKRRIRDRLKNVEQIMTILNATGVKTKELDRANMEMRYSAMSPMEKYTFFSRKHRGRRPVHMIPKWTRIQIPTAVPYGYK